VRSSVAGGSGRRAPAAGGDGSHAPIIAAHAAGRAPATPGTGVCDNHAVGTHGADSTRTRSARRTASLAVAATCAVAAACAPAPAGGADTPSVAARFPCTSPNSLHVPCHFSTPSGNIRCLWTPSPNNVACDLVATGRGYRLKPSGHARAIRLRLARRGETLPVNQQLVFPQSMSCHDTRTTMTCNQDFGFGEFKLAPHGSHAA
jgi:hypothetical protein